MPTIIIQREHCLGLPQAKVLALRWVEEGRSRFGVQCHSVSNDVSEQVMFNRSGIRGSLVVTGDQFNMTLQLGLLFAAFAPRIQAEIEANIDALLADSTRSARSPTAG